MLEKPDLKAQCPRCGQSNLCAMLQGNTECWCRQLPVLALGVDKAAAQAAACFCQACLAELTAAGDSQQRGKAEQYKPEGTA